jgi:hypothetical protein
MYQDMCVTSLGSITVTGTGMGHGLPSMGKSEIWCPTHNERTPRVTEDGGGGNFVMRFAEYYMDNERKDNEIGMERSEYW